VENWSLNPRPTGQFTVTNGRVSDIVAKLDASIAARPQRDQFAPTGRLPCDRGIWHRSG